MAPTTYSATQRAVSPGAQALLNAVLSTSVEEEQRASHLQNLRHAEILACDSVADIVELIPDDYRMFIADHLHAAAKHVHRLCGVQATLTKWRHHRTVGTLPPPLRGDAPKCQFSSDYAGTDAAKAHQKAADDRHAAARLAQLDSDIAARTLEETFLLEAIAPEKAILDMRSAVAPHAATIMARYKVPSTILDPEGTPAEDVRYVINPQAVAIRDQVMADCGVYAHRAIAIAFNAGKREQLSISKKKDLADKAQVAASDGDTVMGDATLATAIQREVKRQVMGHNMPRDKKTKVTQSRGGGGPSNLTRKAREAAATVQATVIGKGQGARYGTRLAGFLSHSEIRELKSFTYRKRRSGPKPQQERYTVVAKAEGSQKKRGKRGKGGGKGKQQQQQQASTSTAKPDRKGKGRATYLRWLEEMTFQHLGSKYMFHQPTNANLIMDSWMDFQRRLRWKIMFMFEGNDTEVYDPDYDVRGPK
ncbi:hypothetical protein EDB85DRAFT_1897245 [Lactarius pseudohatsudake]|nr:hypothetical protein EDB85DRAFT_1897245 [Lactarius pseudohatsudake]